MRRFTSYTLLAFACAALLPFAAAAKPKPAATTIPVVEKENVVFPSTASNGIIRITPKYFGPARPGDPVLQRPADPMQEVLVFEGVIDNSHGAKAFDDTPKISLADSDGVKADTRDLDPAAVKLSPGEFTTVRAVFWAPKTFTPDRVVFNCGTTHCKTIQILLKR